MVHRSEVCGRGVGGMGEEEEEGGRERWRRGGGGGGEREGDTHHANTRPTQ